MNAHLIHFVEGPLASDFIAANDAVFDVPPPRKPDIKLALVPEAETGNPAAAESNTDNAAPANTTEQDDYALGGYAGI
jgi:hypothetical protein